MQKQHEQAIAAARRAIALDPNFAEGYEKLGEIMMYMGRNEEVIGLTEKAMRLNPQYSVHYSDGLGWAYHMTGRTEEAIAVLKKALALNPDYLFGHFNLAFIYSELGREEEAWAEAAEVLRLSPNFSLEGMKQTLLFEDPAVVERLFTALRKAGLK